MTSSLYGPALWQNLKTLRPSLTHVYLTLKSPLQQAKPMLTFWILRSSNTLTLTHLHFKLRSSANQLTRTSFSTHRLSTHHTLHEAYSNHNLYDTNAYPHSKQTLTYLVTYYLRH